MPKRPRPPLDEPRLRAVLDAAEEEFAAHGFAGASYNRIIERAGLSKGVMYYHFDDKSDLFRAVVRRAADTVAAIVGPWRPSRDADDFRDQLRALTARALEAAMVDPRAMRLVRLAARAPEMIERAYGEHAAAALRWTVAILDDGRRVGAVRDDLPLELLASAALGLGQGLDAWFLQHLPALDPARAEALLAASLDLFFRLLAPP